MQKNILSSNIDFRLYTDVKSALKNEFGDEDSFLLGRISKISGADASTIQNWVKRGFITKADGKKYSREQAMDIILLNAFKEALPLEKAAKLIAKAKSAGKITSEQLLTVIANVLIRADNFNTVDRDGLEGLTDDELYSIGRENETLSSAALAMVLACIASSYRQQALGEMQSSMQNSL